jgi:hypothetical protein
MSADQLQAAYALAYLVAQLGILVASTGFVVWVYFKFWRKS